MTGLTSNPTIFDHAIKNSTAYDAAIRQKLKEGKSGEEPVLRAGARGPHPGRRPVPTDLGPDERRGRLGVVGSVAAAGPRHGQHSGRGQGAACPGRAAQSLHQDPRHQGGSARHRRGDLRRRAGQRDPAVLPRALRGGGRGVSAWHRAAHRRRTESQRWLRGLGVHQPLGRRGHGQGSRARCATGSASPSPGAPTRRAASCSTSPRWQRVYNAGARPQRLLWASTGTKDPKASDVLYIKALAAPFTVNTMPEGTLKALADHGEVGPLLPADGGDCEEVLAEFAKAGIDSRRSGRPTPGRRREVVRQVLERTHDGDRLQERGPGEGRLESAPRRCGNRLPRETP